LYVVALEFVAPPWLTERSEGNGEKGMTMNSANGRRICPILVSFAAATLVGIAAAAECFDKAVTDPNDENVNMIDECTETECNNTPVFGTCAQLVRDPIKLCGTESESTGKTCAMKKKAFKVELWQGTCDDASGNCLCTGQQYVSELEDPVMLDTCVCVECSGG